MHRHVVGFMGDGINDAPALRVADVGISVDTATDIAKESADLILLEKDLMVLEGGVTEGRKVFANILKYIRMGTALSGSTRTIIYVMWSGISVNQCPVPGKLVMECIIETKAATILEFIQGLHGSLWVTLAPPTATPCGCGQPYFINLTCRCVAQTELVFQRALTEYRLCRKH